MKPSHRPDRFIVCAEINKLFRWLSAFQVFLFFFYVLISWDRVGGLRSSFLWFCQSRPEHTDRKTRVFRRDETKRRDAAATCSHSRWSSTAAVRGLRGPARITQPGLVQKQSYCGKRCLHMSGDGNEIDQTGDLSVWGKGWQGLKVTILCFRWPATPGCVSQMGLKPPAEPKSGFCRKFRILTSPQEKNKSPRSGAQRTFTQRTHCLCSFPNQPPQREKAGGKVALTISCMVELFVGSNRQTRLRSVEKNKRDKVRVTGEERTFARASIKMNQTPQDLR